MPKVNMLGMRKRDVAQFNRDMRNTQSDLKDRVRVTVNRKGIKLHANAVQGAPVDNGDLRGSIRFIFDDHDTIATVGTDKVYAPYVEFGTAPHLITPKNKKALSWKVGKKRIFVKSVRHPGTEPNPFMRNALKSVDPEFRFAIATDLRDTINGDA